MKHQIINEKEIDAMLFRISRGILEKNRELSALIIIGIRNHGDLLAKRIANKIESIEGEKVDTSSMDITFYRDDVNLKAYKYIVKNKILHNIKGRNIILVDDVIFTGRTIRAAIDGLIDCGRPDSIQLAVLIDRGGRELPIQPDYVGKRINANTGKEISVYLKEIDGEDRVEFQSR